MEEIDKEKEKIVFKKPDLSGVSSNIEANIKKPIVKAIAKNAYLGLLCYAVIFILGEILISGGKSQRNPYFIAVMVIFLLVAQLVIISKNKYSSLKSTIISAVTVTLTIAILDFLLVNFVLEKNSLALYKYWPQYLIYLTALALPFIRYNWASTRSLNLKLLLTKRNPTL